MEGERVHETEERHLIEIRCAASLCDWKTEAGEYVTAEQEAIEHMRETGHKTILRESVETWLRCKVFPDA